MEMQQPSSDSEDLGRQEGEFQPALDFSEIQFPEPKKPSLTKRMLDIASIGMLSAATAISAVNIAEMLSRPGPWPEIEYTIPDGMTTEQAERAAEHVEIAEAYYRMGIPFSPFFDLTEDERSEVKMFLESVAPQTAPSLDDWRAQATQQHLVRMLEDLGSPQAGEERQRAERHLESFFDQQREASNARGFNEIGMDNQAREVFYLMVSCSGKAEEICQKRLAEIDGMTMDLSRTELRQIAQKNIDDMAKHYTQSRISAEGVISRGTIEDGLLSPFFPTPGSIAVFSEDLLALEECRTEGKLTLFSCDIDGVECSDWQVEVYDYGGEDYTVTFRNKEDHTLFCTGELQEMYLEVVSGGIPDRLKTVVSDAAIEEAGKEQMASYDLPADAEVTYLRVFAPSSDPVIGSWIHTSMLLANAMESRYGDRFNTPEHMMSNDPALDLMNAISGRLAESDEPQHFVIDLYEHGDRDMLGFPVGLTGHDLAYIARCFPECSFDINSIACFGGGLEKSLQREFEVNPDLAERMNLFVHTRPDESNLTSEVTRESGMLLPTRGSLYHFHMIEALLNEEIKTFGEVLRHADLKTKEQAPLDARSLLDGRLIAGIAGERNPIIV